MYGSKLKQLIARMGWSQKDIAEKINSSQSKVSFWLNSEYPPLQGIEQICNAIGVEMWEVFISEDDLLKTNNLSKESFAFAQVIDKLHPKVKEAFLDMCHHNLDSIQNLLEK